MRRQRFLFHVAATDSHFPVICLRNGTLHSLKTSPSGRLSALITGVKCACPLILSCARRQINPFDTCLSLPPVSLFLLPPPAFSTMHQRCSSYPHYSARSQNASREDFATGGSSFTSILSCVYTAREPGLILPKASPYLTAVWTPKAQQHILRLGGKVPDIYSIYIFILIQRSKPCVQNNSGSPCHSGQTAAYILSVGEETSLHILFLCFYTYVLSPI